VVAGASELLGAPVAAVVPLQRHHPAIVLAASIAEISALAALVATGSLAAMVALIGLSLVLIVVVGSNRRQVVALTRAGNVVLTASASGRPTGVAGPLVPDLCLPPPTGLGVSLEIGGRIWWVDRSSFRLLRRARLVQAAEYERQ
jgi:hypothetical protein